MCSEKDFGDLIKGVQGSIALPAGYNTMYSKGSFLALAPEQSALFMAYQL